MIDMPEFGNSPEKVCIVGLARRQDHMADVIGSLNELGMLVETSGGQVTARIMQKKTAPSPSTLVGKGKVSEILNCVLTGGIRTLVFDSDLTPAQQRNLELSIPVKVLDRTRLILDIFAQRARSREGILQVEMAQLMYMLPRLTGHGALLSQQVGGIGTRGPGERKLEYDRRRIRDRITHLRKQIALMRTHRTQVRSARRQIPLPLAAIVGYTNAGKSTLLNALSGRYVYSDDMLFATLDPTTRSVSLPHGGRALFTDTVGLIQKLPHHLVAAFQATLEEIKEADLLIHVIDVSRTSFNDQAATVEGVLKDLGADKIPTISVYNKSDMLGPARQKELMDNGCLLVSAAKKHCLDKLLESVEDILSRAMMEVEFDLPYNKRYLLSAIYRAGWVVSEKDTREGAHLKIKIAKSNWGRLQKELGVYDAR